MKKPKHIILLLVSLMTRMNEYAQYGPLRTITDSAITLAFTDHDYSKTLELNRINRTITETKYIQNRKYAEAHYNQYHTEIGKYKAFDEAGGVFYVVNNERETALLRVQTGEWIALEKPESLVRSEELLRKRYGTDFVKKHLAYFPNDYFQYGTDTIEIKEHIPCPPYDTITYTREFDLKLSNGKLNNTRLCVPFFLDSTCIQKITTSCKYDMNFNNLDFNDSFEYYYAKAKQWGLSRSLDYITMNLSNESCNETEADQCSGFVSLNIIEMLQFDTTAAHANVVYNIYQFNPWTKEFLGKTMIKNAIDQFLFGVINFENEVYIHRFKDPLIKRPGYLDDIIKLFHIKRYQYILDEEASK